MRKIFVLVAAAAALTTAACNTVSGVGQDAQAAGQAVTGAANMSECMTHLRSVLPADAILTNGAGNYAAWLHRFHRHAAMHTQLAPTSGAMPGPRSRTLMRTKPTLCSRLRRAVAPP